MNAEFIAAVRPVIAWARANGWQQDVYRQHFHNETTRVRYSRRSIEITDRRTTHTTAIDVSSTQQAVDVLAALGVLPPHLSSQWQAGRDMALTAACVLIPDALPDGVEGVQIGGRS